MSDPTLADRTKLYYVAKAIHESKIELCWGRQVVGLRDPWPTLTDKLPPDFGYEPQPWIDIAWTQARAALKALKEMPA